VLDALDLPKPDKLDDTTGTSSLRTVTLNVPAPQAATPSGVDDGKDATDQKALTGNPVEPTTKADDTAAGSGRQGKSPFGAHRESGTKTAETSDKADNSTGEKSTDK
jgi:hypothetical protein